MKEPEIAAQHSKITPPSVSNSYRSEITVRNSSPPSSADEQPGDGFDEIDAAEPLLELAPSDFADSMEEDAVMGVNAESDVISGLMIQICNQIH